MKTEKVKPTVTIRATQQSSLTFHFFILLLIVGSVVCHAGQSKTDKWSDLKLWYSQPAENWTEALPVGNGRLGAMVYGKVSQETIQFNEDTLWTGIPRYYHNPGAKKYLPEIRKLLFEGRQREAEQLAMEKFMSVLSRLKTFSLMWARRS